MIERYISYKIAIILREELMCIIYNFAFRYNRYNRYYQPPNQKTKKKKLKNKSPK